MDKNREGHCYKIIALQVKEVIFENQTFDVWTPCTADLYHEGCHLVLVVQE